MEIKAYSLLQNIKKFLARDVINAMQIKRFIEVDENEFFAEIGYQLVYLNSYLFKTAHKSSDWKSYRFRCIEDEQG